MTLNPPPETLNHHYPETPPLSINFIRKIPESGTRAWNRLAAYFLQLDMHIERAGAALLRCQPAEPGRITVVWWKVPGADDDDEKEPVPVIWKHPSSGLRCRLPGRELRRTRRHRNSPTRTGWYMENPH